MKSTCLSCHGVSWVEQQIAKIDATNRETDEMVLAATQGVSDAWRGKLAHQKNPFDETPERQWVRQWLFYANSVRYATAMNAPDYAAFKNGWWDLTRNLELMKTMVRGMERERKKK